MQHFIMPTTKKTKKATTKKATTKKVTLADFGGIKSKFGTSTPKKTVKKVATKPKKKITLADFGGIKTTFHPGTTSGGSNKQIHNGMKIAGYGIGGSNTLPVYQKDDWLTQLGKQAVNTIVGVPKTALGIVGLAGEGLRQLPIQATSLMQGKGLKAYKSPTTARDMLGSDWGKSYDKLVRDHPTIGNVVGGFLDVALDPINLLGLGEASAASKGITTAKQVEKGISAGMKVVSKEAQIQAKNIAKGITTKAKSGLKLTEGETNIVKANPKTFAEISNNAVSKVDQDAQKVYEATQAIKKPHTPAQDLFLKNRELNRASLETTIPKTAEETPIAKIVTQKELKPKVSVKEVGHNAYTHIADVYHPLVRLDVVKDVKPSLRIENTLKMARDSRGTAEHIIDTGLVDRIGKPISKGYNQILNLIKKEDLSLFAEHVTQKHNISRMKYDKPIYGKSVTAAISKLKVAMNEKAHPEFKKASVELNQFMKNFADEWGVNSGRVDKESMEYLHTKYPDYIPIYRANDPNYLALQKDYALSSGKFIKQATGGSSNIVSPLDTIPMYINSVVKKARQNETYQAILHAVRKNPDKMASKGVTITQTGIDTLESLAKVGNIDDIANFDQLISSPKSGSLLIVMEKGKPITLKINDVRIVKALQELQTGHINGSVERMLRKGTNIFKAPITTYNPIFAVNNISRDVPTAIMNSRGNPLKQVKNTFTGVGDMLARDPLYKQYSALSGRGGNFFSESKVKSNFILNFNNMSEDISRFAAFKTAVQKGKGSYDSIVQGLADAKDITVDFGRYGDWIKTVDSATPYLNASVQGIDKFLRQVTKYPKSTVAKGLVFITAGKVALDIVNSSNPYYKELSRFNRDNNYCIPNIFGEKDKNGIPKTFIKIKMPREYGVLFGTLLSRMTQKQQGLKDEGFKDFADTVVGNFAPASPVTNNIFAPFFYNLPANKTWSGSPIVSQGLQGLPNKLQYDEKTSSIAKSLGDVTNISPKQIDYVIKSYTGIFGQFFQPMTTDANQGKNIGETLGKSLKSQFTLDPLYSNDAQNDFYTNLDKISKLKRGADLVGGKVKENLASGMTKASSDISTIRKYMKQVEVDKTLTIPQRTAKMRVYQQRIVDIANRYNKLYEKGDDSVGVKYPEVNGEYYPNNYFTRDSVKYTMNYSQYEEYRKIVASRFNLVYNRYKNRVLKDDVRIDIIEDCRRQAEDYGKDRILLKLK